MSRLVLHVDEMVLRGLTRAQGDEIAAALESSARSLLESREGAQLFAALADGRRSAPDGRLRLASDATPANVGGTIASHLVGGSKP